MERVDTIILGSAAALDRQYDKYRRIYEGKVVRSPHKRFSKQVYLVANNSKSPFRSAASFPGRGHAWQNVVTLTEKESEMLALLPDGPWLE